MSRPFSIRTSFDVAKERTAHIPPAPPPEPPTPVVEVPMSFEAWEKAYDGRNDYEFYPHFCKDAWNAAVRACALTARWENDSNKYKYREDGPTAEDLEAAIMELEAK